MEDALVQSAMAEIAMWENVCKLEEQQMLLDFLL